MAIKEWVTTYKGANPSQDPTPVNQVGVQENLDDESSPGAGDGDETRSSQLEEIRDKAQAIAVLLGDSGNAPAGSVVEILDRDHSNGDARQLRLRERASDPSAVSNKAFLYSKDDGGISKVYMRWSDGTITLLGAASGQTNTVSGGASITNSGDNVDAVLDLDDDGVTNAKLANMAQDTIKGRASGAGTGDPVDLTGTQATAILDAFTSGLKGLAPASGGGTTNFLRADGTWAAPPSGGGQTNTVTGGAAITNSGDNVDATLDLDDNGVTNAKLADVATATLKGRVTGGSGDPEDLTGTQATTLMDTFTSGLKGLAPASGGGTTNFLRADGTWAAPAGGGGGGSTDISTVLHQNTDASSDQVVGAFTFDKTDFSTATTIKFKATGYVTSGSLTGTLTMYNLTDSSSVAALTFTSVTIGEQISADVKASLPSSDKVYEFRLKVTGGSGPSDLVLIEWAGIEIR